MSLDEEDELGNGRVFDHPTTDETTEDDRIIEETRIAFLKETLRTYVELIAEANAISNSLPRQTKEDLDLNPSYANPAVVFSLLSPEDREQFVRFHYELLGLIDALTGTMRTSQWSTDANKRLVVGFVKILDKLQQRSKLQTDQFFQSAEVGDSTFLLLRSKGKGLEASIRHNVPKEVTDWFQIE